MTVGIRANVSWEIIYTPKVIGALCDNSSKKKRRSKSIEDASLEERLAYLELDMPDVENKLEELDGSQLGFSEMVEVLMIDVKDALDGIKA